MKNLTLQIELSLATPEKIKIALGSKGITDYKRITIGRGRCEEIHTHAF